MAWLEKYYETIIETGYYKWLFDGFGNTVLITLGALLIGVIIGSVIAIVKYFGEDVAAMKPICWLCDLYVTVIRGIPVVVLLLITFFIIFASSDDGVMVAIITFGINSGAYMAELIRGGIQAVDKGQMEAGRSLGLSKLQTMAKIIIPQTFRRLVPPLANEFIMLLKDASLVFVIGLMDITTISKGIAANGSYLVFVPALVIYLIITAFFTFLFGKIEKKLSVYE